MISLFPEVCKAAFVPDGAVTCQRVIDMLKPYPADQRESMADDERRVWSFLVEFANQATEEGMCKFVMVCQERIKGRRVCRTSALGKKFEPY